jgi:hypothetical protein
MAESRSLARDRDADPKQILMAWSEVAAQLHAGNLDAMFKSIPTRTVAPLWMI